MVSIKLGLYIYNQIIDVQNHRFLLSYTGTPLNNLLYYRMNMIFMSFFLIIFVTKLVNFYRRKRYFFSRIFFLKKAF
jgi:hypothetical protein